MLFIVSDASCGVFILRLRNASISFFEFHILHQTQLFTKFERQIDASHNRNLTCNATTQRLYASLVSLASRHVSTADRAANRANTRKNCKCR